MKKLYRILATTAAAGVMTISAQAQSLFADVALEDVSTKSTVTLEGEMRSRQVVVNKAVASQLFRFTNTSKSLKMSLFPGENFTLKRTNLDKFFGEGTKVWSGRIDGFEDGFATLVSDKDRLLGQVQYGGKIFRISPAQSGVHVISEISPESFPEEDPNDFLRIAPPALHPGGPEGLDGYNRFNPPKPLFDGKTGTKQAAARPERIRVMAMFTPTARDEAIAAGTTIRDEALLAMAMANTALVNTGLKIYKLRWAGIVGFGGCTYGPTSSTSTVLNNVTPLAGGADPCVSARAGSFRDARSADLVAVIKGAGGCGLAWFNTGGVGANFGYSVTARACLFQHTFTHELGHNLGLNHDRVNTGSVGSDPTGYNYGMVLANEASPFRTIMGISGCCVRAPVFTGVAGNGRWNGVRTGRALFQTDPAMNRRSLRENWAKIAGFR